MPINGMLTLADVAGAHQQGIEDRKRNAEAERQQKAQAVSDEANRVATGVVEAARATAPNGASPDWQPSDALMFQSAQARGNALIKGGDYEGFFKNQAALDGQRLRVRQQAWERYGQTNDIEALVRDTDPTFSNGKKVTGTEIIAAGVRSPKVGAAPDPEQVRITYDDGKNQVFTRPEFESRIKPFLIPSADRAALDAKMAYFAAQKDAETEKMKQVELAKGAEARKTEQAKATSAMSLAQFNKTADAERSAGSNSATLGAARLGKEGRVEAAGITAETARTKAATVAKDDRVKTAKATQDLVIKTWGEQSGALGGGRIGNEDTLKISNYAQALMDSDSTLSAGMAVQKSIDEFKKYPKAKK